MSRIEELPDDFDENLYLNKAPPPSTPTAPQPLEPVITPSNATRTARPSLPNPSQNGTSTTPSLPPPMSTVKNHSPQDVLSAMNRTPLFMTSLDETDGAGGINNDLEALKALAYEGSPFEVAENFRQQGNECFHEKKLGDGVEFYTKALAVMRETSRKRERGEVVDYGGAELGEDGEEGEIRRERECEEKCLGNRAACNLELKNYRRTTTDCASTLLLNPSNIKAWYRSSCACLALDKIPEALDACTRGLEISTTNTALQSLRIKINKRKAVVENIEKKRQEREEQRKVEERTLRTALAARKIRTLTTPQPPETESTSIHLTTPLNPTSTLNFPLILLYPLHLQSDFIKIFAETSTLSEHLSYILPLPWDTLHEYATVQDVECYMDTRTGGLVKMGKKVALVTVLGGGKVDVVDGIVRVFVVPRKRGTEWIEDFKRKKGVAASGST